MNAKQKKASLFVRFVNGVNHFLRSFKNFFKSSFLSLVVIVIILLLLTQMDQAFTMLVDMMETSKFSLLLCFFIINALALVLSHYPIYTYYAADLNNSEDYTNWHKTHPIPFWPFKKFPIFVFTTNPESNYKPDNWANYLRYSIGILIHCVWVHFIISSFAPNFLFDSFPFATVKIIVYPLLLVPLVVYIVYKEKFTALKQSPSAKTADSSAGTHQERLDKENKLYIKLGVWYVSLAFVCLLLLVLTITVGNFSPGGFVLLLLTSYALIFNYVFFRLLRTKLTPIYTAMGTSKVLSPFKFIVGRLLFLERSENYLLLYNLNFLVALVIIVVSTVGSIEGWPLLNGIPILLSFFYFYYFVLASLGKYFFVTKKLNLFGTQLYKTIFIALGVIVGLFVITFFAPVEVKTHQLDLVKNSKSEITETAFIDSLRAKDDNTLFFIASHGGGLKANVWTLNVVNTLQKNTQGRLLDQTIALSGASGGSLGLALYTGLYKENGTDFTKIQKKIDHLAAQNYTSLDLSLTFGLDSYRKIWPFSQRYGLRDRPYYAMRNYQNEIENTASDKLSKISFRDYWKEAFNKNGYFPSLIMNTAGTQGSRGILWSVKQDDFEKVFPFAVNLADLTNNQTIPYYQAVSTTNRFPVFSPAAKIPGYGYFIDAGAIDNSGLLGCLDVHNYLMRDKKVLGDKQIAYIEIINSKGLYTDHLIQKFKKQYHIDHIPVNENETDNIIADLETGLNLDKIPGYLSDYITNLEKTSEGSIRYFKIMMPHKVTYSDVESHLKGYILSANIEKELNTFLSEENNRILSLTEKQDKSFFEPWEYYEPTLSRHLSKSSINYVRAILKHPLLTEQFEEIESIIASKRVETNKAPQLSL
ncbi:patatin-like phospholipase family protein [Marixanthomonas spongiae]|uniref:Patatin-like phospholipase n=1 Tax=Marixanthomonas spongiae TaxID=2174845 RepID=A0A2U0I0Y7_9FLAO|nr:patatin-like phospholipase family protein [Marixanthomonas spongiae]PVW14757.1 hypothetical protein DDV96_09590 [Marixanthomonas spongiae]